MNAVLEKPVTQTAEAAQKAQEVSLSERQILNRLRKLEAVEAQIKALEAQKEALRAEIIGDAQEVMIDNAVYNLSFRQIVSRRFDSKAFSADHPQIYERYKKPVTSSRFTYRFK